MGDVKNSVEPFFPEAEEKDTQKIKAAADLIGFLVRALKTMFLYPQNNPIPQDFKKNLFAKFTNFLEHYDELVLRLEQNQFLCDGDPIYQDPSIEEGIAIVLHRDGVRQLAFSKGLTEVELYNFLDILKRLNRISSEDDSVTLLWEQDFSHIHYLVVDNYIENYQPKLLETPTAENLEKLYYSEINMAEAGAGVSSETQNILSSPEMSVIFNNLDTFDPDELDEINKLLESDNSYSGADEVVLILFEILAQEQELNEYHDTVALLEKALDSFFNLGNISSACLLVKKLKEEEQAQKLTSKTKADRLKTAMEKAGDKERIYKLARLLNENKSVDIKLVKQYLEILPASAISSLIYLLGELNHFAARKVVCEVLEGFGASHLDLIANGIFDSRWFVVRNIVWVLGNLRTPKSCEYLKRTLRHSDSRVRRESIVSLAKVGTSQAYDYLIAILADPERKIRSLALKALVAGKVKNALNPLWEMFSDKKFKEKGPEEKKDVIEAIAAIGEEEGSLLLKKLIRKRNWFQKSYWRELKHMAIKALERYPNAATLGILYELESKAPRSLSSVVKTALKRVEAKQPSKDREEELG
ncbi:MAG TPA: HEAT repeat domain-containing protein [candidate division Zixibacteria bacterium]|nr:HEAT repeat domain-containing protein [candidate division Zixibacteria bacterium]